MQNIPIKNKQIVRKVEVVQYEKKPEEVVFTLEDTNQLSELDFSIIYVNKDGSTRKEPLLLSASGEELVLRYEISNEFTESDGNLEIQIVGEKVEDGEVVREWRTIISSISIQKSILVLNDTIQPTISYADIYFSEIIND